MIGSLRHRISFAAYIPRKCTQQSVSGKQIWNSISLSSFSTVTSKKSKSSDKLKKVSVTRVVDTNQQQTRLLMAWGVHVAADKARSILMSKDVLSLLSKDANAANDWKAKVDEICKGITTAPDERSMIERGNGTRIHDIIETWLKSGKINETDSIKDPIQVQYATKSFASYMNTSGLSKFKFTDFEVRVESEKYGLKGIIDALATDTTTNEKVIFDWKTGKSVYMSSALQLAAYAKIYEEAKQVKISKGYILRVSKEQPEWELSEISIDESFSVFKAALLLYLSQESTAAGDNKSLHKIVARSKDIGNG